jgi:radical SAM protein with 4Fe4S-binding SPASM domain
MLMITERIDATTVMDVDGVVLKAPKSVKISLDDNCQFRCGFCSSSKQLVKHKMDWRMFTKLIDELVGVGTKEIGLFYIGEPMLADMLPEAIRYCKGVGIEYVFLTTNGHLATVDKVYECMKAGLDSLKFSFNYSDGEQIKEVAKVSPRVFESIVTNIKAAKVIRDTNKFGCGIYASSIMFDGEQGEKMKMAVERILPHVDEHYWLPLFSFGGQTEFREPVRGNPGRLDKMREPLPCFAVFKEGHVTASGDISLCCFDSHNRWVVGNLKTTTFMDAWNCQEAQDLREAHIKKNVTGTACEKCCAGG